LLDVRQDITIPVERSDEPSQELVYEAKPGDFISATIVRIYTDGIPLRVGFNQLVKVPFLRFIGVFLVR